MQNTIQEFQTKLKDVDKSLQTVQARNGENKRGIKTIAQIEIEIQKGQKEMKEHIDKIEKEMKELQTAKELPEPKTEQADPKLNLSDELQEKFDSFE